MILFILIIGFILGELLGYWVHRLLHNPKAGILYKVHMVHHLELYPTNNMYSAIYRKPKLKYNTLLMFAPFFLLAALLLFVLLPLKLFLLLFIETFSLSYLNNWLHDSFHIKPIWLEKYRWYNKLRDIHFIHHQDMSKNMGIFTFFWDRIFKTYAK